LLGQFSDYQRIGHLAADWLAGEQAFKLPVRFFRNPVKFRDRSM
jgi:hypothetical protein